MQELVENLIRMWCWFMIALSPFLLGVIIAVVSYSYFGAHFAFYVALATIPLGILGGIALASYAAERGWLVEFSEGIEPPPSDKGSE
jgi:hypothetical protein